MATIDANIKINADMFSINADHDELIDFICELDLNMQDALFTEQLILRLSQSLASDYNKDEVLNIVKDIETVMVEVCAK